MKTNYHTHTLRCQHAQGSEAQYVKAAMDAGVSILGFSDHAPFPDYDFGLRMPYTELNEYLQSIDALTKKYSADIILCKGLEIEYLPEYMDYYQYLLSEKKLDYLLLGEHFYRDGEGQLFNITQATNTNTYLDYANALAAAMYTGYFKAIAHPDIFAMNLFSWDENCEKACDIIISAAKETGTILEFNANGLRRGTKKYPDGERLMYPHKLFWDKVANTSIPVIVGSDCHEAAQVWDAHLPKSYEILKSIGITPLEALDNIDR